MAADFSLFLCHIVEQQRKCNFQRINGNYLDKCCFSKTGDGFFQKKIKSIKMFKKEKDFCMSFRMKTVE